MADNEFNILKVLSTITKSRVIKSSHNCERWLHSLFGSGTKNACEKYEESAH